jgi:hypothetical protein
MAKLFYETKHFKLHINYVLRSESKKDSDNGQVLTALQITF